MAGSGAGTEGPDPLGKQALYWMPVDAQEPVADGRTPDGARARENHVPGSPARSGSAGSAGGGGRRARPGGKQALYSTAVPADPDGPLAFSDIGVDPLPLGGSLVVECSACAAVTRVGLLDVVLLHIPFGGWIPCRTFDHRMTCPACRRRTWTRVTRFSPS